MVSTAVRLYTVHAYIIGHDAALGTVVIEISRTRSYQYIHGDAGSHRATYQPHRRSHTSLGKTAAQLYTVRASRNSLLDGIQTAAAYLQQCASLIHCLQALILYNNHIVGTFGGSGVDMERYSILGAA